MKSLYLSYDPVMHCLEVTLSSDPFTTNNSTRVFGTSSAVRCTFPVLTVTNGNSVTRLENRRLEFHNTSLEHCTLARSDVRVPCF